MLENSNKVDLKRLFRALQEELKARLRTSREFEHPGAKGEATEVDWVILLEERLPTRYRVGKAFIMDSRGGLSDQIDLVIYDRQYCPILFTKNGQHYIPAEAVYAAFEVKQFLNRENILYAGKKIASVRNLHRTNAPVPTKSGLIDPGEQFDILGGLLCFKSDWSSPFGEHFLSALAVLDADEHIDLGCSLSDGTFEVGADGLKVSTREAALMTFFLTLLMQLQGRATVPAIEWKEYIEAGLTGEVALDLVEPAQTSY